MFTSSGTVTRYFRTIVKTIKAFKLIDRSINHDIILTQNLQSLLDSQISQIPRKNIATSCSCFSTYRAI